MVFFREVKGVRKGEKRMCQFIKDFDREVLMVAEDLWFRWRTYFDYLNYKDYMEAEEKGGLLYNLHRCFHDQNTSNNLFYFF